MAKDAKRRKTTTDIALDYARLGWKVFPCGTDKKPLTKNGLKDATTNPKAIKEMYSQLAHPNIGIRTGKGSNLVVVDVDKRSGGLETLQQLEAEYGKIETRRVRTGGGGLHLYFVYPKKGTVKSGAGKGGRGIDIKADGGYVIAPPSVHQSGGRYKWIDGEGVAELPDWLLKRIRGKAKSPKLQKGKKVVSEGTRNSTLFDVCIKLAYKGLTQQQMISLAREENKTYDPPMEEKEVRKLVENCWKCAHSTKEITKGMSDVSNSEEFAVFLQGRYRYCYSFKKWGHYDGIRLDFSTDEQGQIVEAAKQFAHQLFQRVAECTDPEQRDILYTRAKRAEADAGIQAMIRLVRSDPTVKVRADELDTDPHLANCLNGTINLKTGILQPHDPADLITKLMPVEYPAELGCKAELDPRKIKTWLRCLKEWMCGDQDNIDYLQRLGGYLLTGDTYARVFPAWHGSGKNGKSTFLDTLAGIMGSYADIAPRTLLEITKMEQHPAEMMDLKGMRFVLASEPKKSIVLDVGKIKSFTGDKWGKGRGMHKEWERFVYTHKMVLATNPKPIIRETTDAIWDRLHLMHWKFRVSEAKEDHRLLQKLEKEWPHILVWLVVGSVEWTNGKGHLVATDAIRENTRQFREDSDVLGDFCKEVLVFGRPKDRVSRVALYDAYTTWALQNNTPQRFWISKKRFEEYFQDKLARAYREYEGSSRECWLKVSVKPPIWK